MGSSSVRNERGGQVAPLGAWQPIETAPKDALVLVFAPGEDPRWEDSLSDLITVCQWHPDAGFCVCELREPTHWMPLPDPPRDPQVSPPIREDH